MENIELLLEQANSGDAVAQYKLGRAYETGDGVAQDITTARMWYQRSADNGYKNAAVKLRLLPVQESAATEPAVAPQMPQTPQQTYQAPQAPQQAYQAPQTPHLATVQNAQANPAQGMQPAQSSPEMQPVTGQKSKGVAALLALFLGYFGAHDFYLGYKKQGIIKVVLTISMIGAFISGIWTLIDLIKILCNGKLDSNGQLLS